MRPLDATISRARALVVDGNAGSRSAVAAMLHDFGVSDVKQVGRASDARRLLETQRFDVVVCEYHFDSGPVTGQDLIDDLRLGRILPLSTVVVMISSEANYSKVAEAAEAALDAYLIKPHTQIALRERLALARRNKMQLQDIIELVETGRHAEAAEACALRFEARGPAWLQAARIGADLWLHLGKPHIAEQMLEAILRVGALPWARLGLARSQLDRGATVHARRTLESLLGDHPQCVDAYDVMARVLLEQGAGDSALDALRRATELTPGSVTRLVKHGLLAFYYGHEREASQILERAARIGQDARVFDLQALVLLAATQFDRGDRRGLTASAGSIAAVRAKQPDSARLQRFGFVIEALKALSDRRLADAMRVTRSLLADIAAPSFDFEAACNLLSLLARLGEHEVKLDGLEHEVTTLARRFAVSKTTCDLLARSARQQLPVAVAIRSAYDEMCDAAEQAVALSVRGQPMQAAGDLLARAEATLNAKFVDLARHTIERHRDGEAGWETLEQRAAALDARYRAYGTQVRLGRWSEPRTMPGLGQPGGESAGE